MPDNAENLQKYEELFAQRFSSEDHEYQQYRSRSPDLPPLVEDWNSRGRGGNRGRDMRNQDRHGRGGWGRGRGWGGDRGWRGGQQQQQQQQHWHDRDRQSGHGSRYQSCPPSSNQGYSSNY